MTEVARVVLVTGASSGIGAALARRIAGPDTALMLHARGNEAGLEATAAAVGAAGSPVAMRRGDFAAPGEGAAAVSVALESFGRVDQIVANAGFANRKRFGEATVADLRHALAVMTESFFGMVTAALPHLEASSWGRVVAVGAFGAHSFGAADTIFPTTAAAKAAVETLARALAWQLAPMGTTVNCVVPGYTRKEAGVHAALDPDAWTRAAAATPMRKLAEPGEVAAMIAMLLGRDAGHVTGQSIAVDGGLSLL
ncbi:MAG: SDR family NAD(P)-dependent oxidoreductase [Alphaproteobacteria bacterium]